MRIAIIAPPWVAVPPSAYGGTETVLDTLARGLVDAGHDVLLFTTGDSTCPVRRDWTFERALGVGVPGSAAEIRHVLAAYERVWDFDIVHDHTLVGPLYAGGFPHLATVTTIHGPFLSDLGHLYRAVGARVPVIAISHHQASTATGVNLAGVIHHGVDLDRFGFGDGRGGYALFLGRMHPDKGVHTAARVARAAGVRLKIAAKMSEPHELAYFAQQVQPLLGGGIEYIGEVGAAEKARLLGEASCLLNPIAWPEPFGMVMIEAFAAGTPVIATPAGAAPEIVEHGRTGYLAATDHELVAALARVGELDRQSCRQAAERRFSARRMVNRHIALYRQHRDAISAASQSHHHGRPSGLLGARGSSGPFEPDHLPASGRTPWASKSRSSNAVRSSS